MRLIIGSGKVARILEKRTDEIVTHRMLDITDADKVDDFFSSDVLCGSRPQAVINTAAKINLEWCEEHKREAYHVNTIGPLNLLHACARHGLKFVHISSGCIFDGNRFVAYESTPPNPACWYAKTKVWADEAIKEFGYSNYLIIRPRQLISAKANPTNMLTKFLNMDSIGAIDEENSLTCIEDMADVLQQLIEKDARGIFNICNTGTLTPYKIACQLRNRLNRDMKVTEVDYQDYLKTISVKRVNTILSNSKLLNLGINIRTAQEALNWCIENYQP